MNHIYVHNFHIFINSTLKMNQPRPLGMQTVSVQMTMDLPGCFLPDPWHVCETEDEKKHPAMNNP